MAVQAKNWLIWICAVLLGAALGAPARAESAADSFPVIRDARIAGDSKITRFVLDLDRRIDLNAFALANPYRLVIDLPQVTFQLAPKTGENGRGLIKVFRYGLVMTGGSRIVMDLTGPAKIDKAYVLDASADAPARLIVELSATSRAAFLQSLTVPARPSRAPAAAPSPAAEGDARPVVVLDPGHGGIDTGTQGSHGETEKMMVLDFALALKDHLDKAGKYRVVMTRADDTFISLAERVRMARAANAALFISIHADALPRGEGDVQGASVYTLSDRASDAEAERLAEAENRADLIAGIDLSEEPSEVADILIDLAQRETRTFSSRFAKILVHEMKGVARMHKKPVKSAGFRVLRAPDVPSVLVELGYVSNKENLQDLMSNQWRMRTVASVAQAVDGFFASRLAASGAAK
ncbi:MAG: N-acetylmuramoyl-L-alanine amidase [Xanthobacteraceae bacterium]|nr:MAG: N-acetylmuramoyl-L-alanine amidase [Xanthobacteraceae bacterium]